MNFGGVTDQIWLHFLICPAFWRGCFLVFM